MLKALGSVLTDKYAEGYPSARWYCGCDTVDGVEGADTINDAAGNHATVSSTSITADGSQWSSAHGLGASPRDVSCVLECITNDNGYVVGDKVLIGTTDVTTSGSSVAAWYNATNVGYSKRAGSIYIPDKGTGNQNAIDPDDWKVTFEAWL